MISNINNLLCKIIEFWKQKYLQATSDLDNAKRSFEAESAFAGDALKIELKQLQRRLQV